MINRRDLIRVAAAATLGTHAACGRQRRQGTPGPLPAPSLPTTLSNRFDPDTALVVPLTEEEVADIVRHAGQNGSTVRVRGSAHSVTNAIYASNRSKSADRQINMYLSALRDVAVDVSDRRVRVSAGANLGIDPVDPSEVSTFENSLLHVLSGHGWALPDLGGIVHQTVAGFLSTGSDGGSTQHSVYDAIIELTLIDGTGERRVFRRPADGDPADPFFGAVIAMGLLGVVTSVTFQCEPTYTVRGREDVYTIGAPDASVDIFSHDAQGIEAFLRSAEYSRLLWWPQPGVNRLQVWQASRAGPPDGPGYQREEFEFLSRFEQRLAREFFELFEELNPPNAGDTFQERAFAFAVNLLISEGDMTAFWDEWWRALPMDNGLDFTLLPTTFTEAWCPLEAAGDITTALHSYYRDNGFRASGTNACEIYAAGASPFWMSPAHDQDVIRIDPFWFADYEADPARVYFPWYWSVLDEFEPRYHWGKHLPIDPAALRRRYARWDDFLQLRAECDPNDVFLTDYWRLRLGLT